MSEFPQYPEGFKPELESDTPNVHWVKPNVPTVLGDLEKLAIPGTDRIFASVSTTALQYTIAWPILTCFLAA